jgi:carboxyl-terminal processing protease
VNALLASPAGKPVNLSVIRTRRADPEQMTVNREVVQAPPVEAKMVDSNVAYLKIPFLAAGKTLEAKKHLEDLLKKGATSVILDLRATAGGEEKEALELANLFIDSGTLGYLQGQKFEKKTFVADPKQAVTKAPLAILVNQGTAGAAEIVAGAVEDNHRGQIVGTKTFGVGSVQKLMPLEDGSALLISVAKYYTPSGKQIQDLETQDSGIKPTVETHQANEDAADPNADDQLEVQPPNKTEPEKEDDRQLNKAIEILRNPSSALKKAA